MRGKVAETASRFVQPGETIMAAVSVVQGSKFMIRLRAVAMLMSRFRIIAVTEANVYILTLKAMSGTKANGVRQRHSLGAVEVYFEPNEGRLRWEPLALFPVGGSGSTYVVQKPGLLHVGDQRFWVRARETNNAWAVAEAATH